jgi:hypothetical protein
MPFGQARPFQGGGDRSGGVERNDEWRCRQRCDESSLLVSPLNRIDFSISSEGRFAGSMKARLDSRVRCRHVLTIMEQSAKAGIRSLRDKRGRVYTKDKRN